jgi:hypothetical protein
MFSRFLSSLIVSFSALAGAAYATNHSPIERCANPKAYWQDQWFLNVNTNDESSKESLLQTFALVTKKGFQVIPLHSGSFQDSVPFEPSLYLKFLPENVLPKEDPEQVKRQVLEALVSLPGNEVRCSPIFRPSPAIGVQN